MMNDLPKIHWSKINTPFVFMPIRIQVNDEVSASKMNLPCPGVWKRDGEFFVLEKSMLQRNTYEFDESKCHECQNWGAPTGCGTCGLTCMGG